MEIHSDGYVDLLPVRMLNEYAYCPRLFHLMHVQGRWADMLAKECTVALLAEGLDPWWGLYHKPRHGRPALALDLMEEFRPLVVDSAVITAINTGMVTAASFQRSNAACLLTDTGRKAFIRAYEARLDQLVTHPIFDYRCSWRSVLRLQARLLVKWLAGDVPEYRGMTTR